MVRYAGGVALLDAPHSTPTTYVAWLCAKKTSSFIVLGEIKQIGLNNRSCYEKPIEAIISTMSRQKETGISTYKICL
jgi:hypothetical protein